MSPSETKKDAALIELRSWIRHWQDDVGANLAPTQSSLRAAMHLIDQALSGRAA